MKKGYNSLVTVTGLYPGLLLESVRRSGQRQGLVALKTLANAEQNRYR
jgi:hypothetical protein